MRIPWRSASGRENGEQEPTIARLDISTPPGSALPEALVGNCPGLRREPRSERSLLSCRPETADVTYRRVWRSEEHTSELQSLRHLVCRLLLEKKKIKYIINT